MPPRFGIALLVVCLVIYSRGALSSSAVSTCTTPDATAGQVLVRDRLLSELEVHRMFEIVKRLQYSFGETDYEGATPAGAVHDVDIVANDPQSKSYGQPTSAWTLGEQLILGLQSKLQPIADSLLANGTLALLLDSGAVAEDRARTRPFPYRGYVNQFRRGDHPTPHRDAALGSPHLTILVYGNARWRRDWGGETFFYSEVCVVSLSVSLCDIRFARCSFSLARFFTWVTRRSTRPQTLTCTRTPHAHARAHARTHTWLHLFVGRSRSEQGCASAAGSGGVLHRWSVTQCAAPTSERGRATVLHRIEVLARALAVTAG